MRGRQEKAPQGKVISQAAAPYEEAKVVRLAFHLYTEESLSLIQLADRFSRPGIPRPQGGQRWRSSNLGRTLRYETYAGRLRQRRWRCEKRDATLGRRSAVRTVERPEAEHILDSVPPIVPRDLFDAAQRRLEGNLRLARRNATRDYLLTGLLKHACGRGMRGRARKGTTFYYCFGSRSFKARIDERGVPRPCSCGEINGQALESVVWDRVTGLLRDPQLLERELDKLREPDSSTREALEEELRLVTRRLEQLPTEERRLVEGYRKGFYADFMMREELDRLHEERDAAVQRSQELQQRLAHLDQISGYRQRALDLAPQLVKGLGQMDFEERRDLLRLLVEEVVYDDRRLTIRTIIPLAGDGQLHSPVQPLGRVGREKPTSAFCKPIASVTLSQTTPRRPPGLSPVDAVHCQRAPPVPKRLPHQRVQRLRPRLQQS